MNEEEQLKALLPALQQIIPTPSDSTMRLLSLVRIYAALYQMIIVNDSDDEFGDREEYACKADKLFHILLDKANRTNDIATKSELVSALFTLTEGTSIIREEKRMNSCYNAVIDLMKQYGQADSMNARTQAYLYRSLIPFFAPEAVEDDEWFILLRNTMTDWANTQSPTGSWEGISSATALKRMEVMNSYSYSFLDSRLDGHIRQAYDYYHAHISTRRGNETFISKERLHTLGEFYGMTTQGNACPMDWKLMDKISSIMENQSKAYPFGSDAWLYCISFLVENWCDKIVEEIQPEILTN